MQCKNAWWSYKKYNHCTYILVMYEKYESVFYILLSIDAYWYSLNLAYILIFLFIKLLGTEVVSNFYVGFNIFLD